MGNLTRKTINELLENRFGTMLEWTEPWKAYGPEGNEVCARVVVSASVHDCINLHRASDKQKGLSTIGEDARRLDEFMCVHWATVAERT